MSVDENVSIKHVNKNIDDNMWIKCIAKSGPITGAVIAAVKCLKVFIHAGGELNM